VARMWLSTKGYIRRVRMPANLQPRRICGDCWKAAKYASRIAIADECRMPIRSAACRKCTEQYATRLFIAAK